MHMYVAAREQPQMSLLRCHLLWFLFGCLLVLVVAGVFSILLNFICLAALPACMSVYYMHVWCSQGLKDMLTPMDLELQTVVSCLGSPYAQGAIPG